MLDIVKPTDKKVDLQTMADILAMDEFDRDRSFPNQAYILSASTGMILASWLL